jgi:hypothetical protein
MPASIPNKSILYDPLELYFLNQFDNMNLFSFMLLTWGSKLLAL